MPIFPPILVGLFAALSALIIYFLKSFRPKQLRNLSLEELAWVQTLFTTLMCLGVFFFSTGIRCGAMRDDMMTCAAPGRPLSFMGEGAWLQTVSFAETVFFVCLFANVVGIYVIQRLDKKFAQADKGISL